PEFARRQARRRVLARRIADYRPRKAGSGVGKRHGGAGNDRAGVVRDSTEDGARHRLGGERSRQQAHRDDEAESDSLHLRPPCAGRAASYPAVVPAPRSSEIACAAATTAFATSLPASVRGSRSVGPATLMAATTRPSWF